VCLKWKSDCINSSRTNWTQTECRFALTPLQRHLRASPVPPLLTQVNFLRHLTTGSDQYCEVWPDIALLKHGISSYSNRLLVKLDIAKVIIILMPEWRPTLSRQTCPALLGAFCRSLRAVKSLHMLNKAEINNISHPRVLFPLLYCSQGSGVLYPAIPSELGHISTLPACWEKKIVTV